MSVLELGWGLLSLSPRRSKMFGKLNFGRTFDIEEFVLFLSWLSIFCYCW